MEICCSNGTMRIRWVAANQRSIAKEMIKYSKLWGSNLYCKCSSLGGVMIWGLHRFSLCLSSHKLLAGNMRGLDFQRVQVHLNSRGPGIWLPEFHGPFGCTNFYIDPLDDSEKPLGSLNTVILEVRPLQEHLHRASTSQPFTPGRVLSLLMNVRQIVLDNA